MAKIWKSQEGHIHTPKGTSMGRHPITSTMNKKKSKSFGERLPESTIESKLFRAADQRVAREAREKRQK